MERRTALKQLMLITSGAILLPACVKNIKQVSIDLKNLKLSSDQEALLAEITETIIPGTETPGAKDLGLHQFVLQMVDDCFEPEQQQTFLSGLSLFEESTEQKFGDSFASLEKGQRENMLRELDLIKTGDNEAEKEKPLNTFYAITKELTVRGYMTSEYVMTNQLYYNMIPGRFQGCVEIKDVKDYKTILG
jgi:hypothetical protein